jgi:hypothetical protein
VTLALDCWAQHGEGARARADERAQCSRGQAERAVACQRKAPGGQSKADRGSAHARSCSGACLPVSKCRLHNGQRGCKRLENTTMSFAAASTTVIGPYKTRKPASGIKPVYLLQLQNRDEGR